MVIKLDGKAMFDVGAHAVRPMSWRRETVERGFAGLNGVMSIDLGGRERKLKQRGALKADSVAALLKMIDEISCYIDGQIHELADQNSTCYTNVRMDSFTLLGSIEVGNQACCDYEIIYTQLSA